MGIGDWGLGIGDWGLGIGPNPQSPIPNLILYNFKVVSFFYKIIITQKYYLQKIYYYLYIFLLSIFGKK